MIEFMKHCIFLQFTFHIIINRDGTIRILCLQFVIIINAEDICLKFAGKYWVKSIARLLVAFFPFFLSLFLPF